MKARVTLEHKNQLLLSRAIRLMNSILVLDKRRNGTSLLLLAATKKLEWRDAVRTGYVTAFRRERE